MKQISGTVIVTFQSDAGKVEIASFLREMKVEGTRVSQFRNRYAIEVPAGEEEDYVQIFSTAPIIDKVNPHYLKGIKERSYKPKKEDDKLKNGCDVGKKCLCGDICC